MSGKNERFGSRVFVHVDINTDQYDFFFCVIAINSVSMKKVNDSDYLSLGIEPI